MPVIGLTERAREGEIDVHTGLAPEDWGSIMRGHRLYRALAEASLTNARRLRLDAKALQKRGSRGHACSLSILAIEESAKGIIYKRAADGIIRFVKKNGNGVTTYSEDHLKVHKYKHATISNLIGEAISFAPLQQTLAETRKATFSRAEVERLLRKAHLNAKLFASELESESPSAKLLRNLFGLLSRLDFLKNAGLYVGRSGGRVQFPDKEVVADYADVADIADAMIVAAEIELRRVVSRRDREEQRFQLKALLAQARRLRRTGRPESARE